MVQLASTLTLGLASIASIVSAHPGHNVEAEAAERANFLKKAPIRSRSLAHCATSLKARGVEDLNVARRENAVQLLRRDRGLDTGARYLKARDLDSVLATDHHSKLTHVDPSTDPRVLFGSEGTCIVQPEVTQGPYYIAGELIRKNVAEDQQGVPLFMDIQLIDTNTCEPLPEIYTDIWHCNATGVYSGVVASGNGNSNDDSNLNTTFLRGVQPSGHDGVVRFESIFPGHYTGRAIHIHVVTHPANETKILPNGTIAGMYDGHSSHVGQIFFDQDLISEVEKNIPYSTNTQELTENADDSILSTEADTTDPFMEYVLLGDDVSDGIFAWISIGIDAKRDDSLSPEGYWTETGGEVNDNFSMNMAGMGDLPTGAVSSAAPSASA
ncbi:Intradiol ring-cleavage dioxygenase [Aspergillus flavus]|uniref:Intradiol ring-cleavage dioxygenase n=3 Tax=Aspergillus subgen. Circumdati TaxID=2720871 RepID=A0A1S9DR68_ASPOZ|nr:protocatechuate 3,4-dioxygenase beta subunit [Aspergillus oryzae 3.042]KAB8241498.1 Intradiol ring-cleavage dioxygenase [Aspergillus flavus]KDE77079.1 protocatechuate 3,4-dioxygenase beta subunit [Aspergillus oryzae 100-8]OOO11474.1 intradiol ring-cleavage dioxygenase [Aspergillus oryzae]RAQ46698.1 extracellular dioxygenase [Aspergillus flavus]|eukprot:EIT79425.1 protocatechuate 3,4-dioxygenase beta subunit [Aspergillus oryzae 3.042]